MMKTRQDNDVTDGISVFYAKNDTELSWLIRLGIFMTKTKQNNDVTDHIGLVYTKIETELSGLIWHSAVCDEN